MWATNFYKSFFQKYFVVHERSAVKNSFSTYKGSKVDSCFCEAVPFLILYIFILWDILLIYNLWEGSFSVNIMSKKFLNSEVTTQEQLFAYWNMLLSQFSQKQLSLWFLLPLDGFFPSVSQQTVAWWGWAHTTYHFVSHAILWQHILNFPSVQLWYGVNKRPSGIYLKWKLNHFCPGLDGLVQCGP